MCKRLEVLEKFLNHYKLGRQKEPSKLLTSKALKFESMFHFKLCTTPKVTDKTNTVHGSSTTFTITVMQQLIYKQYLHTIL